ncbi:MAG TPA: HAMP domain-containing sensor histidine kinase [Anaeromyxobacteraceae bacterium]|nr:HAMP domain-containing sensor histidine kinase [Anaeromyxobacteraceae bacterium]
MPRSDDGGPRTTTGRRLFLAFSSLVCASSVGLVLVLAGLRDIEPALEGNKLLEEKARILLALEIAVREQYANGLLGGPGVRPVPDHESVVRHVRDLERNIAERNGDPEALGLVGDIERATADLDRLRREAASDPARVDRVAFHDRAYALVLLVDERIDQLQVRNDRAIVRLREEVSALHRSTLGWTLGFLVGAPLFAAAVGLFIRRSVARPVAALGEAARRLARGQMDTRIEVRSRDEFGLLAAQFNAMAEALVRHQEEMVQSEKLASVGRLAAGVAHELNNPLGVMIGYLMLHRRKAGGRLARDLWTVEREAHRCREIVRDLLELARPAGVLDRHAVDLRALCDEVVAELRDSGQVPGSSFSVMGAGEVQGNRSKLRQVVLNLVRNGAEAAGAGGSVRVRVEASPEAVEVAVADDGPGLSEESRARIFEPFFTTKPEGTGLGLAVSRAIARAHGGDIALRGGGAGGAVLAMRLPRPAGRA